MDKELRDLLEAPADSARGRTLLDDRQVNLLLRATQAEQYSTIVTTPRVTLFNGQRAYVLVATEKAFVSDLKPVKGEGGKTAYDPELDTVSSGVLMDVRATVTADRKSAILDFRPQLARLAGMKEVPWPGRPEGSNLTVQVPELKIAEVRATVTIPNNHTLLLGGLQDVGEGDLFGPPTGPAARAAGLTTRPSTNPGTRPAEGDAAAPKKPRRLFVLVKPTIISTWGQKPQDFPLLKTKLETNLFPPPTYLIRHE